MTAEELKALGFSANDLKNFDPEGRIVNEKMASGANRGSWHEGDGGLAAVFSLRVQNCTSGTQQAEIFGAANSIVDIPNDSVYSQYGTYRPFTTEQVLCLLGQMAKTTDAQLALADADAPITENVKDIHPPAMVIYDDRTGNLVWIDGANFSLDQWQTFFVSQNPLVASTNGVVMIISCGQRSYRALMSDLRDLVLFIKRTKIIYPDDDGKNNPLTLQRPKSFGGSDSNTIEPENYFEPENQQSKVINIPDTYFVDKLTSIYFAVNGGNAGPALPITFTFSVSAYQNNGVMLQ